LGYSGSIELLLEAFKTQFAQAVTDYFVSFPEQLGGSGELLSNIFAHSRNLCALTWKYVCRLHKISALFQIIKI
jgi:hypothetical protein